MKNTSFRIYKAEMNTPWKMTLAKDIGYIVTRNHYHHDHIQFGESTPDRCCMIIENES